jgi:hypothetical protein
MSGQSFAKGGAFPSAEQGMTRLTERAGARSWTRTAARFEAFSARHEEA